MSDRSFAQASRLLVRRLDELGRVTDEPGRLTRTFLSPAMQRANALVGQWMQGVGLAVREDSTGNLIGRLESKTPDAKTLLLGSHLDTVRDAGRFDGALGVLLPIVALGELKRRGIALPFAVEVLGFSEEEGVRFASAYLGSKGYAGRLRAADVKFCDVKGVTVREAIERWSALLPTRFGRPDKRLEGQPHQPRKRDLLGYVEVHIEQGPVLEAKNLAVGVVSAIAGQSRFKLSWSGQAGHAGTTPMGLRRDALAGAAEFILAAEKLARGTPGLMATVGALTVSPGAANVISGGVVHTLDIRHASDAARRAALLKLGRLAAAIARRRGLRAAWQRTQDDGAVACSPALTTLLDQSVRAVQRRSLSLVSGAGHDAVVMSALTPVAMLFVRCREGLSHHPGEFASPADLEVALRVMIDFLQRFAKESTS